MKTVYITGIAGLLGSNLAKYYIDKGWIVKGCDNLIGGLSSNITDIYTNIDFKQLDITTDFKTLKSHIGNSDVVLHCAALPYEGLSVFSPKLVVENIISGTLSVASICIANNVQLLINFSSMARYGNNQTPFRENMVNLTPEDPYGLAKYQAEQHLYLLNKLHGLKFCTVVPHNVIGVGQRYMDPYRNVVAIMINRVLQNKPIIIYGDGKQTRSFSDVRDCIDAIYKISVTKKNIIGQVYNIGPDKNEKTILEIANLISGFCNVTPNLEFYPDRPAEVKHAWCSSEKIRKEFGYKDSYSFTETVNNMINWIKILGVKPFIYDTLQLEFITESTPKTWVERLI